MVNEKTIKETLTLLKLTYPNSFKDLSKEEALLMIQVWLNDFKNVGAEIFNTAINRLRYKCKYLPTVAEIKSEIALLSKKELQLNPETEWELVLQAVRKFGKLDNVYFEEITRDTIRALGQHRLEVIETSQIPFIKREFIDIWLSKKDGIERCVINNNALSYTEQLMLEQKEIDERNLLEMEGIEEWN